MSREKDSEVKYDFVGGPGYVGTYYGADLDGNPNDVIHGHWAPNHGTMTEIRVTKLDNTAFDLNYFILASNTQVGGGDSTGLEDAYITASNGFSQKLPSDGWGFHRGTNPQIYLDSNFDNITSFSFTVANDVYCFGMDEFYIDEQAPPRVPEPATYLLLGSLAAGLFGFTNLRKKK